MRRFEILEPRTIEDACTLLSQEEDAKLIAGGTALLILIKQGIFAPRTLINLKKIKSAEEITYNHQDGLRIGGLATIYDVESAPAVRQHYPLLARACHVVANIRIRNMATIGGNLAHGDYQSDPPTALVALDARLELVRLDAVREIPVSAFLLGAYENALGPGELVAAVKVPPSGPGWRSSYLKFTTRSSEDRPAVGVAAMARFEGDRCTDARLVVGAVTTRPARVTEAESLVRGRSAGALRSAPR